MLEIDGKTYDLQSILFPESACDGCAFSGENCQEIVSSDCSDGGVFVWVEVAGD